MTVSEYLRTLPADRRAVLSKVRALIRRNLPKGYQEAISSGMLVYQIPLKRFPDTYNGHPLWYVALAGQKNYYALHLMSAYGQQQRLRQEFERAGKKLDMGKACIRFRHIDDLPLDVVGRIIGATTPEQFIEQYQASRKGRKR